MSTFLELAKQLRQETGTSGIGPTTVVDQVGTLKKLVDNLAEAEYIIATLWSDWNFLWKQWTPSASTNTVHDTPSDIGRYDKESFYFTVGTDEQALTYIPYKEWRKSYRDSEDGTPDMYTIRPDMKVVIEPPPESSGSLTADYWKSPVKMEEDADTPSIPERYERVILEQAKYLFFGEMYDIERKTEALNLFNALLPKLEAAELPDREDGFAQGNLGSIEVI